MFRRLCALLVTCLVLWAPACKTSSGTKSDDSLTDQSEPAPPLFREIPADTWYVFTGLEPLPREVYASLLTESESPVPDFYSTFLGILPRLTMGPSNPLGAVVDEIRGKLTPEGLASLGLTEEPHFALYSLGPLPVFRLELSDEEKFRALLARVESKSGLNPKVRQADGRSYRVYELHGGAQVPLVVRDDQVVMAAGSKEAVERMVPYLLGEARPETSLADVSTIQTLRKAYDFEAFSLGYVDVSRILRVVSGVEPPRGVHAKVWQALREKTEDASEVCRTEILQLTEQMPRVVGGTTTFNRKTSEMLLGVETTGDYLAGLAETMRPVPALESDLFDRALFAVGVGFELDALVEYNRERARRIDVAPYECGDLDVINELAGDWLRESDEVPPGWAGLQGAALVVRDLEFGRSFYDLTNAEAMVLARSSNPQAIIGQLQANVPGLSQVELKDDGVPVPLDKLAAMTPMFKVPHVALRDEMLGFSVGFGMQDEMGALLEDPAAEGGRKVPGAMSYNFAKIYRALPKQMRENFERMAGREKGVLKDVSPVSNVVRVEVLEEGLFLRYRTALTGGGAEPGKDEATEQ